MNFRSLRFTLVFPYVLIIILLTITLGGTSYWLASKNISKFSDQYMREATARIAQAVNFHISGSASVLEAAFPEGSTVNDDISIDITDLRTRFWIATSMYTNPNNYVYYGNQKGQSIALKRLSDKDVELRVKLGDKESRNYYRYSGILGVPHKVGVEKRKLDPRTRIWFKLAHKAKRHIWTAVYIDFSSDDLVITRAKRVLNSNNKFSGVVATDVSLDKINSFISSLNVGSKGRAFLVEGDGSLLASNTVSNIRFENGNKKERISALNSGDPVIASAYSGITKLIDSDNLRRVRRLHYTTLIKENGRTIAVSAKHIIDNAGLNWLAIVAIPRDEIFIGMREQIIYGLGVGLIAVLLTILLGMRIFGRIAKDIRTLLEAINNIRNGQSTTAININRRDEVGALADNFNAMHKEIFTDNLTGLANRTALDTTLKAYTAKQDNKPFTLLFMDLNKFKSINDNYGHKNGDLALKEIASRLRHTFRSDDLIVRLGGDEFVVIITNIVSGPALKSLSDKIKATVEEPLTSLEDIPAGVEVSLGVAIGVSYWPIDTTDPEKLISLADVSMYSDKSNQL